MSMSWSGPLGATESGIFAYNVGLGGLGLNLKHLVLGQKGRIETICSRLRCIDRGEEKAEINRALQDIRILLDIMGVPIEF